MDYRVQLGAGVTNGPFHVRTPHHVLKHHNENTAVVMGAEVVVIAGEYSAC